MSVEYFGNELPEVICKTDDAWSTTLVVASAIPDCDDMGG